MTALEGSLSSARVGWIRPARVLRNAGLQRHSKSQAAASSIIQYEELQLAQQAVGCKAGEPEVWVELHDARARAGCGKHTAVRNDDEQQTVDA